MNNDKPTITPDMLKLLSYFQNGGYAVSDENETAVLYSRDGTRQGTCDAVDLDVLVYARYLKLEQRGYTHWVYRGR